MSLLLCQLGLEKNASVFLWKIISELHIKIDF